jgi:tRNA pseudouridine55 synthase
MKASDSGILLIDKPAGPSSSQVVQRVKNILSAKKVGHLGTLDPFASGLLPLGVNDGTKIAQIFLNSQKSYEGTIALGVETDTQDCTGKVLRVRDVPALGDQELEALQDAFTGSIRQVPPMFSAIKRSGVRLYHLARKGKSVHRPAREVQVERLRLWRMNSAEVGFDVTCSKGTYVRALAADMGGFLGCGAHLKVLRRLSCGHLTLERAIPLEEVVEGNEQLPLIPLKAAVGHIRQVSLEPRMLSRLRMGQQEALLALGDPREGEDMLCLMDWSGGLAALAHWVHEGGGGRWRLFRVFMPCDV